MEIPNFSYSGTQFTALALSGYCEECNRERGAKASWENPNFVPGSKRNRLRCAPRLGGGFEYGEKDDPPLLTWSVEKFAPHSSCLSPSTKARAGGYKSRHSHRTSANCCIPVPVRAPSMCV